MSQLASLLSAALLRLFASGETLTVGNAARAVLAGAATARRFA